MSAAPASDRRSRGALVSRFAVVGLASTGLYFVLALAFAEGLGVAAVTASLLAYVLATVFSYLAQKFVTFRSHGAHTAEAPRFLVLTAFGFAVATALPALGTQLGWPSIVPFALTCVVIPVVNFFVLDRWVFARGS